MHSSQTGLKARFGLMLAAMGVVYGDIGTSPLYAIKECFHMGSGGHHLPANPDNILGVLSIIFWAITLIVSLKYVTFVMRADNRGEGGMLALMALTLRGVTHRPWLYRFVTLIAIFGASLFMGECVITPAISVLSAVEGLEIITPTFRTYILPISIAVLLALFLIQKHGTARVGRLFGPVMLVWFVTLALLGLSHIGEAPQVLKAINPAYAFHFFRENQFLAFVTLGSAVLAITGTEALYADMGHFGAKPIQFAWIGLVKPALLLNYFGQGAFLIQHPEAVKNPFFMMAPTWLLVPLVLLATAATVIASQAVISGAYSMTQQAVQLGFLPRIRVDHTSDREKGQIYISAINWTLLVAVIFLVLIFQSSSALASAYGIAVTMTMVITSCLAFLVMWQRWKPVYAAFGTCLAIGALCIDGSFVGANLLKLMSGGWVPLVLGAVIFTFLTTWKRGRQILVERLQEDAMPLDLFIDGIGDDYPIRVPGTSIFLTSSAEGVPHALLHNLKHNKVLHERVILLTAVTADIPYVPDSERLEIEDLSKNFFRMTLYYGFKDEPNIPKALEVCERYGVDIDLMDTSFFLSRETLIATRAPGMAIWREKIFVAMSKNAQRAGDFFKIPTNRVVELGTQVEL